MSVKMPMDLNANLLETLERIAVALEAQAVFQPPQSFTFEGADAFIWQSLSRSLKPLEDIHAHHIEILVGIDQQARILMRNTQQFAQGFAANNALLWGARGMGKSSLVKAVHASLKEDHDLKLIEIYREDLNDLPVLLDALKTYPDVRFIVFCDDLSFDEHDASYKSLKAVLDGGLESGAQNVLFYATSNRRHMMPRDMIENERRSAIHGGEAVEEKVSLSDRFGLWLGFYPCDQDEYLEMIENYARHYSLEIDQKDLHFQSLEWSRTRGSRSGRVAWQFIQDLAGRLGKSV